MCTLFMFSSNVTNKFSHFLILVWNIFMCGLLVVNTPCCSHVSTLIRVTITQGIDNKQNHKTEIKQKVIYCITR